LHLIGALKSGNALKLVGILKMKNGKQVIICTAKIWEPLKILNCGNAQEYAGSNKGNSQLRPAFPLLEETFCTFQMRFKRVFPLACLFEFFPEHQRSVRFFVILT
jgi:hypothetical protein